MKKSPWHKILFIVLYLFLQGIGITFSQVGFTALPDCTDNTGVQAAFGTMYVHINTITGTDGVNNIHFLAQTASASALSVTETGAGIQANNTSGTLLISGITEAHWGQTIFLTLENNSQSAVIELPIPICGFVVDTHGSGATENAVSNGVFCEEQHGKATPAILAQVLPDTDLVYGNDITSEYVYVLVDNTDNDVIEAYNQTGLFEQTDGIENDHSYTLYAFYVSEMETGVFLTELDGLITLSAGDNILESSDTFSTICYNYCCQKVFMPNCCEAEAGNISNAPITACVGATELVFDVNINADANGNIPPINSDYAYVFLVVESGNIVEITTSNSLDFSSYTGTLPITYTIYGFSYKTQNINKLTAVNNGSIEELVHSDIATLIDDISTTPAAEIPCGELTNADFTVRIFDIPTINPQAMTTCLGGFVEIDGLATGNMPFSHEWTIIAGANTTATGITLSNDDMEVVRLDSDISGTAGTVELEYSITSSDGCSTNSRVMVTIAPCGIGTGDDVMLDDPCDCLNNATNMYNGQFAEVISIHSFAANQDWYIKELSAYNLSNNVPNAGLFKINSSAPPALASPLSIGTSGVLFTDAASDGIDNDFQNGVDDAGEVGLYYLQAIHYDGLGFVMTVANDALGITRTITNKGCYYPNPSISVSNTLCSAALPLDLTGMGGAVMGSDNTTTASMDANGDPFYRNGAAFFNATIAGNYPAGGTFNLYDSNGNLVGADISSIHSNLPYSGTYTLQYTFNEMDAVPSTQPSGINIEVGPFDRGCVQSTSITIQINIVDCNSFPWNGQD